MPQIHPRAGTDETRMLWSPTGEIRKQPHVKWCGGRERDRAQPLTQGDMPIAEALLALSSQKSRPRSDSPLPPYLPSAPSAITCQQESHTEPTHLSQTLALQ